MDEIFASKHRDSNSVATIEDKCYVFTFNEYCRSVCQIHSQLFVLGIFDVILFRFLKIQETTEAVT